MHGAGRPARHVPAGPLRRAGGDRSAARPLRASASGSVALLLCAWVASAPERLACSAAGVLATRPSASSEPSDFRHAYQRNRGHGVAFRNRQGPGADGWARVELHPNYLHFGRSACLLGRVRWPEVRRLAEAAEATDGPLRVIADFRHCAGHSSPLRLLRDPTSLHRTYAALLVDRMVQVRFRETWVQEDAFLQPDAKWTDTYCPRRGEPSASAAGPTGVMLAGRPDPRSRRRHLALVDPQVVCALRRKLKPHWPKVWVFAKRMAAGEAFPPVRISWRTDTDDWRFKDGCHRYFAALVSGTWLLVSFKPGKGPQQGAAGSRPPAEGARRSGPVYPPPNPPRAGDVT